MKISAKAEYACVALLELARSYENSQPVRIKTIADAHAIPPRFLVQILLQLKGAGYVISTRGAAGGYRLSKSPEEISVAEILATMEGPPEPPPLGGTAALKTLRALWLQVQTAQQQLLGKVNIQELLARVQQPSREMYHI